MSDVTSLQMSASCLLVLKDLQISRSGLWKERSLLVAEIYENRLMSY